MPPDIQAYHQALSPADAAFFDALAAEIGLALPDPESKVWHGHPVWFLADKPIVEYRRLKGGVRLMFWRGQSFDEPVQRRAAQGAGCGLALRAAAAGPVIRFPLPGF